MSGKIHWKDSIFLERTPTHVKLSKTLGGADDPVLFEIEVPLQEWQALLAHMSVNGFDAASFRAARALVFGPIK